MYKSWEYWAAIAGIALYSALHAADAAPLKNRISKTVASGFLTIGLSPSLAEWTFGNEVFAAVLIMAFGLFVLDVATGLLADREFIKEVIKGKLRK